MAGESITSTESFRSRLQRSEFAHAVFTAVALCCVLVVMIGRRLSGLALPNFDAAFIPAVSILLLGIAVKSATVLLIRRQIRNGHVVSSFWHAPGAAIDISLPLILLLLLQSNSPEGDYSALTSPPLLLIPFVIMLSILRLRPALSLALGIFAAVCHWLLVDLTLGKGVSPATRAMLHTYGVIIVLSGVAAAIIARRVRNYVRETVDEAVASERAEHALSAVRRDLSIARDIQMGLMPSTPPALPRYDIAGAARPAEQTGGDYYDWQPLPDGRLAVVIADVAGHGIGPALVMAVCRAYARAVTPQAADPDSLLTRINSLIAQDLKDGRFITMCIALLSEDGRLEIISAGHGPTLLYRAAGRTIEQFAGNGVPLGVLPDEHYGPHATRALAAGDVLVMLTDGFFEYPRAGDHRQFGIERVCQALLDSATLPAREILERLDGQVRAFAAGNPQPDDMTAVVIRRLA